MDWNSPEVISSGSLRSLSKLSYPRRDVYIKNIASRKPTHIIHMKPSSFSLCHPNECRGVMWPARSRRCGEQQCMLDGSLTAAHPCSSSSLGTPLWLDVAALHLSIPAGIWPVGQWKLLHLIGGRLAGFHWGSLLLNMPLGQDWLAWGQYVFFSYAMLQTSPQGATNKASSNSTQATTKTVWNKNGRCKAGIFSQITCWSPSSLQSFHDFHFPPPRPPSDTTWLSFFFIDELFFKWV